MPKGPGGGLQVAGSEQEIPIHEDSLVLSGAMIQIFDGGKLTLGAPRIADGKLEKSEFGLASFEKIDVDKDGKLDQAELYLQLEKAT